MPSIDRPGYCDWETAWWWTSSVRYSLPKALQMSYVELCWKIHDDGGATKKDVSFLARFLMDTEDNVNTILQLPHFYDNQDGTIGHRAVDRKLDEQKERRLSGKRAVEARWEKARQRVEKKADTGRNTPRNTGGNTERSTGPNSYEGLLASKTPTSEKGKSGISAGRSASAPSSRSAGGHPVKTPVVPGARVPTVWRDNDPESEAVLSEDGKEWISTVVPSNRLPVRR